MSVWLGVSSKVPPYMVLVFGLGGAALEVFVSTVSVSFPHGIGSLATRVPDTCIMWNSHKRKASPEVGKA